MSVSVRMSMSMSKVGEVAVSDAIVYCWSIIYTYEVPGDSPHCTDPFLPCKSMSFS